MFNRNNYRIFANVVMIMVIAFVLMDFVGLPVIGWYQTSHAIKLAKGRLDLLRADMDPNEVKTTLGLTARSGATFGRGSGTHYTTVTRMGYGHYLEIVRNWVSSPPRLVSVSVDDKTWKPQDDLTNK